MVKKYLRFGAALPVVLGAFVVAGCASINALSNQTISKYGLDSNLELFKSYQYYVSRDIVLTNTTADTKTGIKAGQAYSSTNVERDIKQILSSTPGVALEVKRNDTGRIQLGIAFEPENDNLLWFSQEPGKNDSYFYLVYTNPAKKEISYAGKSCTVSYEQASGIDASFRRLLTIKKTKDGNYENKEPLLLYEESARVTETEQRKTLQGRRL
ncbi:MAG: hypothetical protein LBO04_01760 [Spirochaetaceae bacterium]|jgi:hypothetical protein|nr:hypothetical protein [Spirochaetaceae bacterium]